MFSDIPPNQENILRTFLMIPNDEILRIQVHIRLLIHYLKNKVGVVDFANAQGVVMF